MKSPDEAAKMIDQVNLEGWNLPRARQTPNNRAREALPRATTITYSIRSGPFPSLTSCSFKPWPPVASAPLSRGHHHRSSERRKRDAPGAPAATSHGAARPHGVAPPRRRRHAALSARRDGAGLPVRDVQRRPDLRAVQQHAHARRQPALDVPPGERHRRRRVPRPLGHRRLGRLGHQPRPPRHGRQQRLHRLAGRQRHRVRPHGQPGQHHVAQPAARDAQVRRARRAQRRLLRRRLHHLRHDRAAREHHPAEHGVAGRVAQRREHTAAPVGAGELGEHPEARLPLRLQHRGVQLQAPPQKYPRISERGCLGHPDPHRRHHRPVPARVRVRGPGVVLPPHRLPVLRLHPGRRRLGPGAQARQRVRGHHLPAPPQHRHRHLLPGHAAGVRAAAEARQEEQVQALLEHLPPLRRLLRHHPQRHQHLQGLRRPQAGQRLQDRLHCRPGHARRHRALPRGHHLAHRHPEAQARRRQAGVQRHRRLATGRVSTGVSGRCHSARARA